MTGSPTQNYNGTHCCVDFGLAAGERVDHSPGNRAKEKNRKEVTRELGEPSSDDADDSTDEDEFADLELDEESGGLEGIDGIDQEIDADIHDDPAAKLAHEVVELSSKEQSARSLEIRRAIEPRMEERQLHQNLDYLDIDIDE